MKMKLALADWFWRAAFNVVRFALIRGHDWNTYEWNGRLYLDIAARSIEAETLRDIARHLEPRR